MKSGGLEQMGKVPRIAASFAVGQKPRGNSALKCESQLCCCPGPKRLGEQNSLLDLLRLMPSGKGRLLPESSLSMNRR